MCCSVLVQLQRFQLQWQACQSQQLLYYSMCDASWDTQGCEVPLCHLLLAVPAVSQFPDSASHGQPNTLLSAYAGSALPLQLSDRHTPTPDPFECLLVVFCWPPMTVTDLPLPKKLSTPAYQYHLRSKLHLIHSTLDMFIVKKM